MPEMTWPQATVFIVSALIAALPGYWAYRTAKRVEVTAQRVESKQDDNTSITLDSANTVQDRLLKADVKQTEIVNKTQEIHDLTNSKYDKLQTKLDAALSQNVALTDLLKQMVRVPETPTSPTKTP